MKYARAALRLAAFPFITFGLCGLWMLGSLFADDDLRWRQFIFRIWSRAFARLMGMKIEVVGKPPRPPFFLVANHLSYTDIPLLRAVLEGVFVAKGEMESWPLGKSIVGGMGNVFVNRRNPRDIPRAGREILKRVNGGEGVIVFPEGTSSRGETILKFNSSFLEFAAQAGLPVHYAAVTYRTPDNRPPASTVCWWEPDDTLVGHMWRVFQIPEFTAVVTFGDEPLQSPNRKELARRLREKVRERFIPVL